MGNLGIVLFIIVLVIFMPLLSLWSLNTLFPVLDIPYTWQTWLAAWAIITPLMYNRSK